MQWQLRIQVFDGKILPAVFDRHFSINCDSRTSEDALEYFRTVWRNSERNAQAASGDEALQISKIKSEFLNSPIVYHDRFGYQFLDSVDVFLRLSSSDANKYASYLFKPRHFPQGQYQQIQPDPKRKNSVGGNLR